MELKGKFVTQFKVRQQPRLTTLLLSKRAKRQSLVVHSIFRETFPVSNSRWKTLEVHCDNNQSIWQPAVSKNDSSKPPELSFNRLQLSDQEYNGLQRRNFGRFVAREAVLDEEYWTAAWLRAEAHWESLSCMRHVDSYKRKYAEQEFYALKRRCMGLHGNSLKCSCFVAVKKEDKNIRRTVINSVVGTLDLSIRQFLSGETYPGEVKRPSAILASRKYAYVANVCVSKFARRQAIASNMLYLAIDAAALAGMKQLFVHVNADNKPAQELYKKTGFKIIEAASSPLLEDQRILMSMELKKTNIGSSSNSNQGGDTKPTCASCGKPHFGVCRWASGACFECGEIGHCVKDCLIAKANDGKKDGNTSSSAQKNNVGRAQAR